MMDRCVLLLIDRLIDNFISALCPLPYYYSMSMSSAVHVECHPIVSHSNYHQQPAWTVNMKLWFSMSSTIHGYPGVRSVSTSDCFSWLFLVCKVVTNISFMSTVFCLHSPTDACYMWHGSRHYSTVYNSCSEYLYHVQESAGTVSLTQIYIYCSHI